MLAAKELIQEKRYDEARALLKTVDHPTAREWLKKLDRIAPPTKSKKTSRRTPRVILGVFLTLLILAVLTQLPESETNSSGRATPTNARPVVLEATSGQTLPPGQTPSPTSTITETPTITPTSTPSPTLTPVPTYAPIRYDSSSQGLQPVLGPVKLPTGIYRVTVVTNGFFIAKVETLSGMCETGFIGLFNLSSGDANAGTSNILESDECEALIAISNVTEPWFLEIEQISTQVNTYPTISLQFDSSAEGLMPVLGPFQIPSGTYRITVNTTGFFIAHVKTLAGTCDEGFLGLFNLTAGQASAGASSILKSQDCAALIMINNVTEPWVMKFEPIAR